MQFTDLPNEIVIGIFHFLSNPPPSLINSLSKPEYNLTFSENRPLKSLSQTNKQIRSLVLPLLFRHVQLDPYYLSTILTFFAESDLAKYVDTVTARLQGPCSHIHPSWWTCLLSRLPNFKTLTVLAAPHVFSEIGQVPIDTSHSWAFKIPYHSMTLSLASKQSQNIPAPDIERTITGLSTDNVCDMNTEVIPQAQLHLPNLLTSNAWTHLTFNESSHLPAYSTYEYFLKAPPSLLTSLVPRSRREPLSIHPIAESGLPRALTPNTVFLVNLISFSYTAIFPFYNHVDDILKCVRQMRNLGKLFLKLCPEPESNVLQHELERNSEGAGRTEGRIDVNDPWNEFTTSCTLIPHTMIYLTMNGSLQYFQTDDVKMIGVRDSIIENIDRPLKALGCWSHTGDGIWKRDMDVRLESPDLTSTTTTSVVGVNETGGLNNDVHGG